MQLRQMEPGLWTGIRKGGLTNPSGLSAMALAKAEGRVPPFGAGRFGGYGRINRLSP